MDFDKILNPAPAGVSSNVFFYKIQDFEYVGKVTVLLTYSKGLVTAFLDINLINPYSRLPETYFQTLENLKMYMASNIMRMLPFRFDNFLRRVLK